MVGIPQGWLAAAATLVVATGCGGSRPALQSFAHDAGALAGRAAQKAESLPDGSVRPRSLPEIVIPRQQAPNAGSLVNDRAVALLMPHAEGLSRDELKEVVEAACHAKDLVELGKATSWEDATSKALIDFGGAGTRRARVQALAQDLDTAKNSTDVISKLSVFSICEVVG